MIQDTPSPSLNAVRSFAVSARCLSFTKAARELHVTQGAINRMVRALEADLGVRLFNRVGRSLELTPAGASYYPPLVQALDLIQSATRSVRAFNGGNVLSINVPATFAMRWLVPRLQKFREEYPEILVDITTKDGPIDFTRDRVDIAVIYGSGKAAGVQTVRMMTEEMGVFCAPALLERKPPLRAPSDLPRHCLLHNSTRPDAWKHYATAFGVLEIGIQAVTFEHFFMVIEAAAAGMGVALLPLYLAQHELLSGRLVQPFAQTLKPAEGYYAAHAPEAKHIRKVSIFKRWLIKEAGASASTAASKSCT
jgi:LysR family transcriptional regulator, glycine cleavage system transcriptional activator